MAAPIARLKGTMIAPGVSKNGRGYSRPLLARAYERLVDRIERSAIPGSGVDPVTVYTSHQNAAGDVTRELVGIVDTVVLDEQDGRIRYEAPIAGTPAGRDVLTLTDTSDGARPFLRGVSIRGAWMGDVTRSELDGIPCDTGPDLDIFGLDLTSTPGVPQAEIDAVVRVGAGAPAEAADRSLIFESAPEALVVHTATTDPTATVSTSTASPAATLDMAIPPTIRSTNTSWPTWISQPAAAPAEATTPAQWAAPGNYHPDGKPRLDISTTAAAVETWRALGTPEVADQYTPNQIKRCRQRTRLAMERHGVNITPDGHLRTATEITEDATVAEMWPGDALRDGGFSINLNCGPFSVSIASHCVDPIDLDLLATAAASAAARALSDIKDAPHADLIAEPEWAGEGGGKPAFLTDDEDDDESEDEDEDDAPDDDEDDEDDEDLDEAAVLDPNDVWIDESTGQLWVWCLTEARYVRTAAGSKRYGLPIGAEIKKKPGRGALAKGQKRGADYVRQGRAAQAKRDAKKAESKTPPHMAELKDAPDVSLAPPRGTHFMARPEVEAERAAVGALQRAAKSGKTAYAWPTKSGGWTLSDSKPGHSILGAGGTPSHYTANPDGSLTYTDARSTPSAWSRSGSDDERPATVIDQDKVGRMVAAVLADSPKPAPAAPKATKPAGPKKSGADVIADMAQKYGAGSRQHKAAIAHYGGESAPSPTTDSPADARGESSTPEAPSGAATTTQEDPVADNATPAVEAAPTTPTVTQEQLAALLAAIQPQPAAPAAPVELTAEQRIAQLEAELAEARKAAPVPAAPAPVETAPAAPAPALDLAAIMEAAKAAAVAAVQAEAKTNPAERVGLTAQPGNAPAPAAQEAASALPALPRGGQDLHLCTEAERAELARVTEMVVMGNRSVVHRGY